MQTATLPLPRTAIPTNAHRLLTSGVTHHWSATLGAQEGCHHVRACLHLHLRRDIYAIRASWVADRLGRYGIDECRVRVPSSGERPVPIADAVELASTSPLTCHLTRSGTEHLFLRLFYDQGRWVSARCGAHGARFALHSDYVRAWQRMNTELDQLTAAGWTPTPTTTTGRSA